MGALWMMLVLLRIDLVVVGVGVGVGVGRDGWRCSDRSESFCLTEVYVGHGNECLIGN
jgi:hypothetical protein